MCAGWLEGQSWAACPPAAGPACLWKRARSSPRPETRSFPRPAPPAPPRRPAVLSFGLSSEYTGAPQVDETKRAKDVDADKQLYSRWAQPAGVAGSRPRLTVQQQPPRTADHPGLALPPLRPCSNGHLSGSYDLPVSAAGTMCARCSTWTRTTSTPPGARRPAQPSRRACIAGAGLFASILLHIYLPIGLERSQRGLGFPASLASPARPPARPPAMTQPNESTGCVLLLCRVATRMRGCSTCPGASGS